MKIETKEIFTAFPQLAKDPKLAVALVALVVSAIVAFGASKFVNANVEAQIFYFAVSVFVLLHSAWIVFRFTKQGNVRKS